MFVNFRMKCKDLFRWSIYGATFTERPFIYVIHSKGETNWTDFLMSWCALNFPNIFKINADYNFKLIAQCTCLTFKLVVEIMAITGDWVIDIVSCMWYFFSIYVY